MVIFNPKIQAERDALISLKDLEAKAEKLKSYSEKRDETAAELVKRMNSHTVATKPVIHRAVRPTNTTPTNTAPAVKLTTAAEFTSHKGPLMLRSEFSKMSSRQQKAFADAGGRIHDDEPGPKLVTKTASSGLSGHAKIAAYFASKEK